jgi:hypothetical protein
MNIGSFRLISFFSLRRRQFRSGREVQVDLYSFQAQWIYSFFLVCGIISWGFTTIVNKPGSDNGSICGKKAGLPGTKKSHSLDVMYLFSVVSRHGQPRVASGVHQFGYARLEQIHILPAREVKHSLSHNIPLTYPQFSDNNFTTTTTPVYNCICNS